MLRAMYTSITGLRNHQGMLDTTANNIANVNTYGFKASTVAFKDMLSQTIAGASGPTGSLGGTNARQIGLGMQVDSITQRHTQGAIQTTGVLTDIAISGDGFFRVSNDGGNLPPAAPASGTAPAAVYQRAGNFKLDGNGDLVTSDGYFVIGYAEGVTGPPVLPSDPPAGSPSGLPDPNTQIRLRIDPATTRSYSIGADGRVTRTDNTGTLQTVGWISMAKFANPAGLEQVGNNKWADTVNSGAASQGVARQNTGPGTPPVPTDFVNTELVSGGLEMSNVDLATEFTEMIRAQRGFQANSRIITTSDEILQELVNLKR